MQLTAETHTTGVNRPQFAARPGRVAAVLALFTVAVCYSRLFILPDVPLVPGGDQLDFVLDGSRMVAGDLPYRDYFQIVPSGADLTYALLIRWLGLHTWLPGLVMICLATVAVVLLTVVAARLMRGSVIALPGLLFTGIVLLASLDATHHWFSTIVAMAAMLVLFSGITFPRIAAAGALCGLAASFTQTAGVTVFLGFLAYLIWKTWREGAPAAERWRKCLLLAGAAAAVFAAVNGYFIEAAGWRQWLFCVIVYPLRYYSAPSVNNWRILLYGFRWSPGIVKWIVFPVMYLLPVVYVIFAFTFHRRWRQDRSKPWDQLLLLAITGFALFLSVAPEPSQMRLSTVSPPAIILLVWLLDRPTKPADRLKAILAVAALVLAIAAPIHHQMRWRAYLDLPAGRTAFSDPVQCDEYRWVQEHTRPGQFFWGLPFLYVPLLLKNPAAITGFDASEYSRPEQIVALVQALEKQHVPLIVLPVDDLYRSTDSPSYHLGPLRDFLRQNYRVTRTFPHDIAAWERIHSAATASPRSPHAAD